MVSNFQLAQLASLPWLEVQITRDGRVGLYLQAPSDACVEEGTDPNILDLEAINAQSVTFLFWKCGRVPQQVSLQGTAEFGNKKLGEVRYKWHPNDVGIQGIYYGQFEITMDDNSKLRWPFQKEALTIEVL